MIEDDDILLSAEHEDKSELCIHKATTKPEMIEDEGAPIPEAAQIDTSIE